MEIQVENHAGERLDAYLAAQLADLSRSRIQTLIRDQFIMVNGNPAKPRDGVKIGDRISIALPEAVPGVIQHGHRWRQLGLTRLRNTG